MHDEQYIATAIAEIRQAKRGIRSSRLRCATDKNSSSLIERPDSSSRHTSGKSTDNLSDRLDLVFIYGVTHPWVDTLVNGCAHPTEHVGGLSHSFKGNVWIDVAAAEEHRGALE